MSSTSCCAAVSRRRRRGEMGLKQTPSQTFGPYFAYGLTPTQFFFFQEEDGIRDADVTGVQTCALPISRRTAGNTRLYSDADVERLRSIQRLTTEVGLNLAGVERVLRLEDELERMQRRLAGLERELRETVAEV